MSPPRVFRPKPKGDPYGLKDDPEVNAILRNLTMIAWSPLAGTSMPAGYYAWRREQQEAKALAARPAPVKPKITRRIVR